MTQHAEQTDLQEGFAFADAFVDEWAQSMQQPVRSGAVPGSVFGDGEVYLNPFAAIETCGADWVADGMEPDDIVDAAIELGGEPKRWNGDPLSNLRNYAAEVVVLKYRTLDIEPQVKQDNPITELEGEA